jgi:hypothetical protein
MENSEQKPIQVKPNLYAVYFPILKEIALKYGYNLVIHGSMNRDMDLIAIPWQEEVGIIDEMINEFSVTIGGEVRLFNHKRNEDGEITGDRFTHKPHGRICYVIDIYRGGYLNGGGFAEMTYHKDPQYYLDISVTPII